MVMVNIVPRITFDPPQCDTLVGTIIKKKTNGEEEESEDEGTISEYDDDSVTHLNPAIVLGQQEKEKKGGMLENTSAIPARVEDSLPSVTTTEKKNINKEEEERIRKMEERKQLSLHKELHHSPEPEVVANELEPQSQHAVTTTTKELAASPKGHTTSMSTDVSRVGIANRGGKFVRTHFVIPALLYIISLTYHSKDIINWTSSNNDNGLLVLIQIAIIGILTISSVMFVLRSQFRVGTVETASGS